MDNKRCCGTCKYHYHEDINDGWVCLNDNSEYYTEFTPYDHSCMDWERRERKA